jgi:hypothetical protein
MWCNPTLRTAYVRMWLQQRDVICTVCKRAYVRWDFNCYVVRMKLL